MSNEQLFIIDRKLVNDHKSTAWKTNKGLRRELDSGNLRSDSCYGPPGSPDG